MRNYQSIFNPNYIVRFFFRFRVGKISKNLFQNPTKKYENLPL